MDAKLTLVYKTYKNDLPWIYYSLLSLKKFVSGPYYLILYCHNVCCDDLMKLVRIVNIQCRIIPVHYNFHGYLKQMVVKANCFNDVTTEYLAIVDSDIIFRKAFHVNELLNLTKKIQWKYWSNLPPTAEVTIWKEAFEKMTKTPQQVYYMLNEFPFVFTTRSMLQASVKFIEMHGMDYETWCDQGCKKHNVQAHDSVNGPNGRFNSMSKIFTEFEWLGFYCHHFSNDYTFVPTQASHHFSHSNKNISQNCIQFWSHGGLTPKIKSQIHQILK